MMRQVATITCILLGLLSWTSRADVLGWSVTATPPTPVSLEPIFARVRNTQGCAIDPKLTSVQQDGATIFLTMYGLGDCLPTGAGSLQDVSLGQLQAGTFSVVVRDSNGLQLTSAQFRVTESQPNRSNPTPLVNYSDLWWNPQESGWGVSVTQHPSGRLFAAWYTYDDAGNAVWFTLQPGRWTSVTTYTGPIFRTNGSSFTGSFDPARLTVTQVGTGTFAFDGPSSGVFSYSVGGTSSSRRIERMIF
jgi:hypothetical protein